MKHARRLKRILGAGAALAVLTASAAAVCAEDAQTLWYSIVTGSGASVGYARVDYRDVAGGSERSEYQETTLREQDSRPTRVTERTTQRLDAQGRTLSVVSDRNVGESRTHIEIRPRPGAVEILNDGPSGRTRTTLAVSEAVRFDDGEALLLGWDPERHAALEFEAFSIDALAVERIVIAPAPGARRDTEGRLIVVRARYDGPDLRGVARMTIDREGQIVDVTQPLYGSTITMVPTDRATAMAPRPPFRLMTTLMVKSPFRIPGGAAHGHIRYRFGFRDGMAFALPQTGEQRVVMGPDGVTVDICESCGPGLATDPASLEAARRPTAWLQSDDPRIRALTASLRSAKISDARKMETLARTARGYLGEIDFAGHYSASETLDRRRGDCTEAAVLLAAFGRAAGIPTKTVSGFVYSRERYHGVSNVFMPHSWVVAYVDGKWRSFDAALEAFDATHIAVTIGEGDLRSMAASGQLGGLLTWDSMTEVRTRPEA